VLLLIVALGLLPALSACEQSVADDRVLRVQEGSSAQQYAVEELVAAIGLAELEVPKDPHFGPNRVFAGFALETLVNHIGLGDASELLLVCADGYRIPFDASLLPQSQLRGLLAIRDTALPADAETHWAAYRHGAEPSASIRSTWSGAGRPYKREVWSDRRRCVNAPRGLRPLGGIVPWSGLNRSSRPRRICTSRSTMNGVAAH